MHGPTDAVTQEHDADYDGTLPARDTLVRSHHPHWTHHDRLFGRLVTRRTAAKSGPEPSMTASRTNHSDEANRVCQTTSDRRQRDLTIHCG